MLMGDVDVIVKTACHNEHKMVYAQKLNEFMEILNKTAADTLN